MVEILRVNGQDTARFTISDRQSQAFDKLLSNLIDELLYGGAKGGGKSVFGCIASFTLSKIIIQEFELEPSSNPPVIGLMCRKQGVDLTNTTLRTWSKEIPAESYEFKKSDHLIVIENTVAIQYGGLDDSDTVKKFNSAEFAFIFVDQAEETTQDEAGLLRGTLRLKIKNPNKKQAEEPKVGYKLIMTANPAICWLKKAFITAPEARSAFVKALPRDNPFLAKGYVDQLTKAFKHNPPLLAAYLHGSWDDLDVAFTVIPSSAVQRCVNSGYEIQREEKRVTVCDLAEDGTDETVIYDFENYTLVRDTIEIYTHRDLMDTCGRLQAHQRKNRSNLICVDKVGLGAGVFSRLQEIYGADDDFDDVIDQPKCWIYGFDGRIKAPGTLNEQTFKNYKTWAWFKARDRFIEGRIDIPDDATLTGQLTGMSWKFTSGQVMMLDSNEDIKEKLGSSPDRATTVVMAIDAVDRAVPIARLDAYQRNKFPRRKRKRSLSWATV